MSHPEQVSIGIVTGNDTGTVALSGNFVKKERKQKNQRKGAKRKGKSQRR
jgi:hypothetical protein